MQRLAAMLYVPRRTRRQALAACYVRVQHTQAATRPAQRSQGTGSTSQARRSASALPYAGKFWSGKDSLPRLAAVCSLGCAARDASRPRRLAGRAANGLACCDCGAHGAEGHRVFGSSVAFKRASVADMPDVAAFSVHNVPRSQYATLFSLFSFSSLAACRPAQSQLPDFTAIGAREQYKPS